MESSIEDSGQETDDIELGDAPSRDQAQDKDSGQETHVQLGDAPSRDQAQDNHGQLIGKEYLYNQQSGSELYSMPQSEELEADTDGGGSQELMRAFRALIQTG
ncbi:hypothetical protein ACOMHN_049189 [Nucella lapillus]